MTYIPHTVVDNEDSTASVRDESDHTEVWFTLNAHGIGLETDQKCFADRLE